MRGREGAAMSGLARRDVPGGLAAVWDAPGLMAAALAYVDQAVADGDAGALTGLRAAASAHELFQRRQAARVRANDFGEIKVRAERGLGQVDAAASPHGGARGQGSGGGTLPGGQDGGTPNLARVEAHTRAAWRKLGQVPDARFDELVAQARADEEAGVSTARLIQVLRAPWVTHYSGDTGWYTPAWVADAAREVLGGIDLDPASCAAANEVVRADRFFTAADDGLAQDWAGRVFMNPPYTHRVVDRFAAKLVAEYAAGRVPAAVVLTNNSTETDWFQGLQASASALCLPLGRVRFWQADPGEITAGLQGQAILYLGGHPDVFTGVFGPCGQVWVKPGTAHHSRARRAPG
jgi:ParB family chromosome partitioning protein